VYQRVAHDLACGPRRVMTVLEMLKEELAGIISERGTKSSAARILARQIAESENDDDDHADDDHAYVGMNRVIRYGKLRKRRRSRRCRIAAAERDGIAGPRLEPWRRRGQTCTCAPKDERPGLRSSRREPADQSNARAFEGLGLWIEQSEGAKSALREAEGFWLRVMRNSRTAASTASSSPWSTASRASRSHHRGEAGCKPN
jgi:hypothetical protein